jgi:hypothetical protein
MSATYDETLATDLDRVRHYLGDTDVDPEENALRSDEHIAAVLEGEESLEAAIVVIADGLIAQFGQEPDNVRLPSGLTVSFKNRIDAWKRLITRMEAKIATAISATQQAAATTDSVCNQAVW